VAPPRSPKRKREDDDPYSILLEHRSEFRRLFKKHPMLVDELTRIDRATLPPQNGDVIKGGLPFKLRDPSNFGKKPRVWTREVGLRTGAAVLRKARTDPGDRGDAVREYCDLVLYLLSRPGGTKITNVVRGEVVAGDLKTVETLLQEEQD
jgi:zinc finger HIT domain-containing protein 3